MTLEELQAEFPHGSRWRRWGHDYTVIDWEPATSHHAGRLWATYPSQQGGRNLAYHAPDDLRGQRIPDPAPCPITKPTTLTVFPGGYIGIKGMATDNVGEMGLVLHPAEPGATKGRYTWEQPT